MREQGPPEFYNMQLERPPGDAEGFGLLFVDAMHYNNYAARLSHSCDPNVEVGGVRRTSTRPTLNLEWFIQNKHSTDVASFPPLPRVRMSTHAEGEPCSDLGRVLLLNNPPARCR
jgi:hypothetical protein